jgi:hypothetical protein
LEIVPSASMQAEKHAVAATRARDAARIVVADFPEADLNSGWGVSAGAEHWSEER